MDEGGREKFITISQPGLGGVNALYDPQDISDNELADARNLWFKDGYLQPRPGFSQLFPKPSGESGDPLRLIQARTSDGLDYLIAVYGTRFYLWDSINKQTILLNGSLSPTASGPWGWTNWNGGVGSDVVYIGNGVDNTIKWQIALTTNANPISASDTTIVLADGVRFPSSGTVIVQDPAVGTPYTASWTSKTGNNTLNLSAAFGHNVPAGSSVTIALTSVSSVPTGRIYVSHQRRLFSIGARGTESTINYSKINAPEDFSSTSGVFGAGFDTIADSEGQITSATDAVDFLLIGKRNSLTIFKFIVSADVSTSKYTELHTIASGKSVGPYSPRSIVKRFGNLDYLTETDGIVSLSTTDTSSSGTTSSGTVNMSLLSQKINPRVTSLFYDNATAIYFDQRGFWAVSSAPNSPNDLILVYDYLYNLWTIWDGWNVADFAVYNGDLYFLDARDGSVNQCFTDFYDGIDSEGEGNPYQCFFYTKRFDFGEPALPKTVDKVFVQGYISPDTELEIDVLFNERGILNTQTYHLKGSDKRYVGLQASSMVGSPIIGTDIIGGSGQGTLLPHFRVYLDVSMYYGFYHIQLRFYSQQVGAHWIIDKIGFNPIEENVFPTGLVLQPG